MSDCYLAAIRILKYRFNSEGELRRKLAAKRFERTDIDDTIARLRDEKWLDDTRFANAYVRTRTSKHIGPKRIERELQAAGVDRDVVKAAVRANVDDERQREDLQAAYDKRRRVLVRRHGDDYLETAEGRNKLTGYLLKRGYDAALVHAVVKESPVADD